MRNNWGMAYAGSELSEKRYPTVGTNRQVQMVRKNIAANYNVPIAYVHVFALGFGKVDDYGSIGRALVQIARGPRNPNLINYAEFGVDYLMHVQCYLD